MAVELSAKVSETVVTTQPLIASEDDVFRATEVMVKQEFAVSELFGIEAKNRYRISLPVHGAEGQTFLFAQERSDAMERICCPLCRALTMNIHTGENSHGPIVLSMEKQAHCPQCPWPLYLHPIVLVFYGIPRSICCASSHPVMVVKDGTGDDRILGTVVDPPGPAFCCNANSIIFDAAGEEVMRVGPKFLCETGMCCPCCADEVVPVYRSTAGSGATDTARVATITRKTLTCAELCGKTNRFTVHFGTVTDLTLRKLVFSAAMLFDLQYWELK